MALEGTLRLAPGRPLDDWLGVKNFRRVFLAAALCAVALNSARAEANWLIDFAKARAEAKAGDKLLLLDFTGSDWCIWCRRLQAEVFSKPEFEEYAKKNLVLMTVDFPRAKPLSAEVRRQNEDSCAKIRDRRIPDNCDFERRRQTGRPARLRAGRPGGVHPRTGESSEELDRLANCPIS